MGVYLGVALSGPGPEATPAETQQQPISVIAGDGLSSSLGGQQHDAGAGAGDDTTTHGGGESGNLIGGDAGGDNTAGSTGTGTGVFCSLQIRKRA